MTDALPPATLRLFVGVFPPRDVVESLAGALAGWPGDDSGTRPVSPVNWHVTLWFLGATPPDRLPDLSNVLRERAAGTRNFRTALYGCGTFPPEGPPRIYWAGVEDGVGGWKVLAESLKDNLSGLGFRLEDRAYQPHLTLARGKPTGAVPGTWEALRGRLEGFRADWTVDSLQLIQSRLGSEPAYETLGNYGFGKA